MSVETMAKPLDKIKKIRSLDEVLTRGGQALSVYREQRRAGALPTDEEFVRLVDAAQFGTKPIIAEGLWRKFFKDADEHFFKSFRRPAASVETYKKTFGEESAQRFIDAAENIVRGRIDLLGLKNLYVGTDIDWHREPLSEKRSPLKHWKEFDDVDTTDTGNKKIIWELNRHQHFFTLGFAFWLTGDERFAKTFVNHLETWMEQNPPGLGVNWSSSLEISFRAMSWIWAFHFFENSDHFKPELFKKALKYLYLHGRHIEQYLSKYYSPNTHLTGEGLGLYYLGTQLAFFSRAKQWRKLGADILFSEIEKQILPDGVYFEQSTWYQRYTVDFYSHFAVLRSLFDETYPKTAIARLDKRLPKAFDFLMQITLPDGRTPIIGDDDGGRMLPLTDTEPDDFCGSLALGAAVCNRGDLKYIAGGPSEEIFWLLGAVGIKTYKALKTDEPKQTSRDFTDGGYCVMRDGFDETDNYLLVDCGDVGALSGGHGHADALAIEVAVHGKTLLVDSGTYTYHESRDLRDYFRSSTAHNTMAVDGRSSSDPGSTFGWTTRAETARHSWIAEDRFDFFEGSHNGYQRLSHPATHTRSILFLKGDYWIMRDLVETTGEHEFSLHFHFDSDLKPVISDQGQWVGDDHHRLFAFGDNGSWQQKESWISNNHANRVNAPFMRFLSSGKGTQEFFTFILPVTQGIDPPDVTEVTTQKGRAFVIKYNGYNDVFVFNEDGETIETGIFDSDFLYSWARLREGESLPDEFVLIDGNRLRINSKKIFETPNIEHAAVRRLGQELYVKTDKTRRTVSLDKAKPQKSRAPVEQRNRDRRKGTTDRRKPTSNRRKPPAK
ncbi:MAG: alginate lyase family protein [Pyrinomonadaceae bacterium]